MKPSNEALSLFDTMYSMQKLRDGAEHCLSMVDAMSIDARSRHMYERNAREFNTKRNEAMVALFALGYAAAMDEDNCNTPTLWRDGKAVAYWHDFGCVELA